MKERYWSNEELSAFCLEFSLLLKAGMSVAEGFSILSENEQESKKKKFLLSLYEKTIQRVSLHQTMLEGEVFPPYLLKLIYIGEETGHLEECFASLSCYYDQRIRTHRLLKETVMFPLVLFVMMLAVVILLLTEVLPIFQSVFAQLGGTLPASAMFFLHMGVALKQSKNLLLLIIGIFVVLAVLAWRVEWVQSRIKNFSQRRLAKMKLGRFSAEAQFASVLSMTISSGLDTNRALEIAEEFCAETVFWTKIHECKEKTQLGMPFAEAVEEEGLLKPMYCRMLAIGIRSGNIDEILLEIARRTEEDSSLLLTKTASMVEPAVVVILSLLVGFLLLSVMFPLVGIMSSLG
ncbi:type II secretion system F family protein [Anaerotignum sp.]|uniref:type II secretion system F family protein n=1 Tax=Anaerotignum sp. TaxID=2039241 RepID=UPI00271475A6|nr:type II secretion system F family protein [Anaerotignum sp.]